MVLDQHVPHSVLERLRLLAAFWRQFPVGVQVKGKLRENPKLALDLHPAG